MDYEERENRVRTGAVATVFEIRQLIRKNFSGPLDQQAEATLVLAATQLYTKRMEKI